MTLLELYKEEQKNFEILKNIEVGDFSGDSKDIFIYACNGFLDPKAWESNNNNDCEEPKKRNPLLESYLKTVNAFARRLIYIKYLSMDYDLLKTEKELEEAREDFVSERSEGFDIISDIKRKGIEDSYRELKKHIQKKLEKMSLDEYREYKASNEGRIDSEEIAIYQAYIDERTKEQKVI